MPAISRSTKLTIEMETRYYDLFRAGKLAMPAPELAADFYQLTQDICAAAGLPAYEISNHARPRRGKPAQPLVLALWRICRHRGPARMGDYCSTMCVTPRRPEKLPFKWRDKVLARGHGMVTNDLLTWEEEGDEYLVMGLRLTEGIDPKRYTLLSGRTLDPRQIEDLKFAEMIETLAQWQYSRHRPGLPGARRGGCRSGGLVFTTA